MYMVYVCTVALEAGLNLSAKDLTNKVFISITNNDTVMWYTMHIFYI